MKRSTAKLKESTRRFWAIEIERLLLLACAPVKYSCGQGPKRIVCLTEEPTEILYALGEQDRIVGISAYTERPAQAKQEKPVVSAYINGSLKKIAALKPDLVIGFSDIQADLAQKLIAANLQVLVFNQRSVQEILDVIVDVGRLVNCKERAEELVGGYISHLEVIASEVSSSQTRPKVYFEEWDEPTISAIQWVSELIEIAGGEEIFRERSLGKGAKDRFVKHEEVIAADPEVVMASWCGKAFDRAAFMAREGYESMSAVRSGRVHEIESSIILQPGPACLTDGLRALRACIVGQSG